MYHLHQTLAFVLGSVPTGETSRTYILLTKDLGLVRARAQGARFPSSKLRPHLRELSCLSVVFVRGKEVWRITGVETLVSYFRRISQISTKRLAAARATALVRRLVIGEEPHEDTFTLFRDFLAALSEAPGEREVGNIETMFALRLLHVLGYVSPDPSLAPVLLSSAEEAFKISLSPTSRGLATLSVNYALRAAGL